MFGVDSTELLIVALAALVFIGPKELPTAMRTVGRWVGRARAYSRHFTAGIENMMREAELEEMEKRWREENERIMREHPIAVPYAGDPAGTGAPPVASGAGEAEPLLLPEAAATEEEPPLPLPEPEHHKRDLP
ncbi:twin-arginine translocase TatA/TatE family subunit [Sphingomonas humi]|uniref:Twin-arginine translocase subunit TatB n=1 Tax=Sphingomonas humi TaxID=335630 RepID=A0ABP7RSV9_9SPHN